MSGVTDKNFEKEIIEKSKEVPVVVDFYADWCMPCKILGPVLEKIVERFGEKLFFAKVNVDDAPETAQKYGIMSIPNIKLFKDGKVVDEFVGNYPESYIKSWIERNLSN